MGNTQSEVYHNRMKILEDQNKTLRRHNTNIKKEFNETINSKNKEVEQLKKKLKRIEKSINVLSLDKNEIISAEPPNKKQNKNNLYEATSIDYKEEVHSIKDLNVLDELDPVQKVMKELENINNDELELEEISDSISTDSSINKDNNQFNVYDKNSVDFINNQNIQKIHDKNNDTLSIEALPDKNNFKLIDDIMKHKLKQKIKRRNSCPLSFKLPTWKIEDTFIVRDKENKKYKVEYYTKTTKVKYYFKEN